MPPCVAPEGRTDDSRARRRQAQPLRSGKSHADCAKMACTACSRKSKNMPRGHAHCSISVVCTRPHAPCWAQIRPADVLGFDTTALGRTRASAGGRHPPPPPPLLPPLIPYGAASVVASRQRRPNGRDRRPSVRASSTSLRLRPPLGGPLFRASSRMWTVVRLSSPPEH